VAVRAGQLASELRRRSAAYRTSHLFVPWGDDFKVIGDARRMGRSGAYFDGRERRTLL
jgi:hypothetical protein